MPEDVLERALLSTIFWSLLEFSLWISQFVHKIVSLTAKVAGNLYLANSFLFNYPKSFHYKTTKLLMQWLCKCQQQQNWTVTDLDRDCARSFVHFTQNCRQQWWLPSTYSSNNCYERSLLYIQVDAVKESNFLNTSEISRGREIRYRPSKYSDVNTTIGFLSNHQSK